MSGQYLIECTCTRQIAVTPSQCGGQVVCPDCGAKLEVSQHDPFAPTALEAPLVAPSSLQEAIPEVWKPGDILLGQYEVQEILGRGAMGTVYKVYHQAWNQHIAVKSPLASVVERFGGAYNFEHECETWTRIGLHPNVVACFYARRLGGIPRVFAEYIDGGNLLQRMSDRSLYQGTQREVLARILQVAVQMAWGLHHAHRKGVIHQDIKPANIMMTLEGVPKVTDFGLARVGAGISNSGISKPGEPTYGVDGMTPAYCSPEQAERQSVTHKTDLWSWAMVVLQLFTLRPYCTAGPEAPQAMEKLLRRPWQIDLTPQPPPLLIDLLRDCFRLSPGDRPNSLGEAATRVIAAYEAELGEPFPILEPPQLESSGNEMNNRAVSLLDLGKITQAREVWRDALKASPGHLECAYNYALVQWRCAAITDSEALEMVSAAAESGPSGVLPHLLLARIHLERGDTGAMERSLQHAAKHSESTDFGQDLRAMASGLAEQERKQLEPWAGHAGAVTCLAIHEPSRVVVSGADDNSILVRKLDSGEVALQLTGHANTVAQLAVSPDGAWLASAGLDRRLKVWDLKTGECVASAAVESSRPCGLAWTAAAEALVLADTDGNVRSYRADESLAVSNAMKFRGGITAFATVDDRARFYVGKPDGKVATVSMSDLSVQEDYALTPDAVVAVTCDSASRTLAAAGKDHQLWVAPLDASTGPARPIAGHRGNAVALAFTAEGARLVSIAKDKTLRLFDAVHPRCRWTAALPAQPVSLAHEGGRDIAYVGLADGTVARLAVGSRAEYPAAPLRISRAFETAQVVALERQIKRLLDEARAGIEHHSAAAAAAKLRKIRARSGIRVRKDVVAEWIRLYPKLPRTTLNGTLDYGELRGHDGGVRALEISFNGRYAVSGGSDGVIGIWDLGLGERVRTFLGHASAVRTLALSDDQKLLVSGGEDATLRLWDVRSGQCKKSIDHPGGAPESIARSAGGRFLASAGWELGIWDLQHFVKAGVLEGHPGGNSAVLWARSNRFIVSGGADARIKFWNPYTGRQAAALKCPAGPVHALAMSLDEGLLAAAAGNPWDRRGRVCVWNIDSGDLLCQYEGHETPVSLVCMSSDGSLCVSAGADGAMHLWETRTGKGLRTVPVGGDLLESLAMSADASRVLCARSDGIIRNVLLDWEVDEQGKATPVQQLRFAELFACGLRPILHPRFDRPDLPPGSAWPLAAGGFPKPDDLTLKRITYLAGCAGCAGLRREHILNRFAAMAAEVEAQNARKQ
ncbi:MAG: protein kinase [Candidatus Hydrogenedens sp.]|nr:protein kinase [Candidatus Hydrogenedens sp.]